MRRPQDTFDRDVEWLLCEADHAIGHRSSMGQQIDALLRGTPDTTYDPSLADPYQDWQVSSPSKPGVFDRHRRLWRVWTQLPTRHQAILTAQYCGTGRMQVRNPDGSMGYSTWPPGVLSEFGHLSGLALALAYERSAVEVFLRACQSHDEVTLAEHRKGVEMASREAHRAFREFGASEWLESGNGLARAS